MKQIRTWQKYVAGALLMGTATVLFSLSSVLPVEAADATSGASTMPPQRQEDPMAGRVNPIDHNIDTLVQEGKITQDQATKLKKACQDFQKKEQKDHQAFEKSLPSKTGIDESTLKEIFKRPQRRGNHRNPQAQLNSLVAQGKVTQEEATTLDTYFKSHRPDKESTETRAERPDTDSMISQMSEETGISKDRLQEIGTLMHKGDRNDRQS
ncbi:MAG: hypothetical protein KHX20_01640 [Megasphaera sp.]|nr:hypothetical protein [Megasphaera sp.]